MNFSAMFTLRNSFLAVVVTYLFFNTVLGYLVGVKPKNTLVGHGEPATFTCCCLTESCVVKWTVMKQGSNGMPDPACDINQCQDGYRLNSSVPRCFQLIINKSTSDYAGLYQCTESSSNRFKAGAYLIVYNFAHVANVTTEAASVELRVHFDVSWVGKRPYEIRLSKDDGLVLKAVKAERITDEEPISKMLSLKLSRSDLKQSFVASIILLNEGITDDNVDKSTPSISVEVKYPVSNILFSCPVDKCERSKGDVLECAAYGHPKPEVYWTNWKREKISSGPVLPLESLGTHEYTCNAQNVILEKTYTTEEMINVHVADKLEDRWLLLVENLKKQFNQLTLINIIMSFVVILVIVFHKVCWKKIKHICKRFNLKPGMQPNASVEEGAAASILMLNVLKTGISGDIRPSTMICQVDDPGTDVEGSSDTD